MTAIGGKSGYTKGERKIILFFFHPFFNSDRLSGY